jgi:hypothetical protein
MERRDFRRRYTHGKAAYLAALFVAWATTSAVAHRLLSGLVPATDAEFYAVIVTVVQLFVAVFFSVWLRHMYQSEGGKVAVLALSLLGAALALIVTITGHIFA